MAGAPASTDGHARSDHGSRLNGSWKRKVAVSGDFEVERTGIEPVPSGLQSRNPRRNAANTTARTRLKWRNRRTGEHTARPSEFPSSSPGAPQAVAE